MRREASVLALALATLLGLAAPAARADPGESPDTLAQFLREKSLVAADAARQIGQRANDIANDLVVRSLGFVGLRYRRGGTSAETGFDCSGFVRHVYQASLGMALPRRADEQAQDKSLVKVDRADLRPGDLVFFNTMKRTFSHVGIYIGDNRFVHSPKSGEDVRTDNLAFSYWSSRFTGARRAADADVAPSASVASVQAAASGAPLSP